MNEVSFERSIESLISFQPTPWSCGATVLWEALQGGKATRPPPLVFVLSTVPSAVATRGTNMRGNKEVLRAVGIVPKISGLVWANMQGSFMGPHGMSDLDALAQKAKNAIKDLPEAAWQTTIGARMAGSYVAGSTTNLPLCAPPDLLLAASSNQTGRPRNSQPHPGQRAAPGDIRKDPADLDRDSAEWPHYAKLRAKLSKASVTRFVNELDNAFKDAARARDATRFHDAVIRALAPLRAADTARHTQGGKKAAETRADHLARAGQPGRAIGVLLSTVETGPVAVREATKQVVQGIGGTPAQQIPVDDRCAPAGTTDEWLRAVRSVFDKPAPPSAAGPSGLTPRLLWEAARRRPKLVEAIATLCEIAENEGLPEPFARGRMVVLKSTKPNGRVKYRAIACGEALTRVMERAFLVRYRDELSAVSPDDHASQPDGALRCAVRIQDEAARGNCVVSVDASRAYDTVLHSAITETLVAARVPTAFALSLLSKRSYMLDGHHIRPPGGVGLPQGSAMAPKLFACVAQRAANAARAAGVARIDTYLDNLYIVDEEVDAVPRELQDRRSAAATARRLLAEAGSRADAAGVLGGGCGQG